MTNADARFAALLIDADNLSATGMEQAVAELRREGLGLSVLRAYGSLETLGTAKAFIQRHGGKAVLNHGPGTTDAALVVDAMDMLHAGQLPATVAIGSGDGDFAPLAVRLREAGRQVVCFAQGHKAAVADLQRVYASVVLVDEPATVKPVAKKTPRAARKSDQKAPAAKQPRAPAAARQQASKGDDGAAVLDVLESIPALRRGESVALNEVVKKLRDAGLMGKSAGASSFFKKFALPVQLMPARQPNQIRLRHESAS
ncbi:MAG: NYN domain-containing protein [Ramlibacter sp.]